MGLSKAQQALVTKARTAAAGGLGLSLDDGMASYLLLVIADDLNLLADLPDMPQHPPPFWGAQPLAERRYDEVAFLPFLERLLILRQDVDTYFYCLAVLHKARLKYERILQAQPMPTIDQVGPRALLQYGSLSPQGLAGWLFWRKWLFDVDNRAGQETGYVFEPIIAYAIGGVPYSAARSPIRQMHNPAQGRQVDCIRGRHAYEIKLRVTTAASGQGRWGAELAFPADCRASGYIPVLIVLDPTPNAKLAELQRAFSDAGGDSYAGQAAWDHLASLSGGTMARFLELYVHQPLNALLREAPPTLPRLTLELDEGWLSITIGDEALKIERQNIPQPHEPDGDIDDASGGH